MAGAGQESLVVADAPAEWPDPPLHMTVTTLAELETCPRRWALSRACYPGLWSAQGYPPRARLAAMAGTVVHLALETITRELVRAGCSSVSDPIAYQVMKELGGHSNVVHESIARCLHDVAGNPRAPLLLDAASVSLHAQVPELRARIQNMLCRLRLPTPRTDYPQRSGSRARFPLTVGAYAEVELRGGRIAWQGRADLLVLSNEACVITDVKTGAHDESHQFQMQVYALLWYLDTEVNPSMRRADQLILRYLDRDVEVPAPTVEELEALRSEIVARGDAARVAASGRPPRACPAARNCQYCGVRQLCDEYWTEETQRQIASQLPTQRFLDAELLVMSGHGPSSWDVEVSTSSPAGTGQIAVLRTNRNLELPNGSRVRVVGAALTPSEGAQPVVLTLTGLSEIYRLRSGEAGTRAP